MEGMNARLLSRFKWGLSADLQVPDLETRIAIIEKKLYKDGVEMPKDVVEYLAYSITTNVRELEGAMAEITQLKGILPICASCKKIRDDKGYWNRIESYIKKHSEAEFSHSICPDCYEKHYKKMLVK